MSYYIGVDVGGTFTDGVVVDEGGEIWVFKVPTTPSDPSEGFLDCLKAAAHDLGLSISELLHSTGKLTYGTTIATNTLVQRKGSKVGIITTRGFRDTLPVSRIGRDYLPMDLQYDKPVALVPRHLIREVTERIDYKGSVVVPLIMEDVEQAVEELVREGVEAIAVCLLWSFKNPEHENMVSRWIEHRYSDVHVSTSHEIAPLLGEYERTATTTMNAILASPIRRHLRRLNSELRESGLARPLLIMQATGGVVPAEDASARPVNMIGSGPAGGVMAAQAVAEQLDFSNAICLDMGGTTLDVALINDGRYSASVVSRAYDHSIFVPMIDIYSMGAGGGSIAWMDLGRRLKVGPQSAGAEPGPVCYDRGGEEPTVTDANLILGYLNENNFLGGRLRVNRKRAEQAIRQQICGPLELDLVEAAAGIVRIVESNMVDCIRGLTLEKGYDPREYTIVSYGGAGSLHASALARELGINRTVVPYFAPVQSAYGIVTSDIVHSFSVTDISPIDDAARLNRIFDGMERRGYDLLEEENVALENVYTRRSMDVRYLGQMHEVTIPVHENPVTQGDLPGLVDRFEERYESLYGKGSAYRALGCEAVTLMVDVVGATQKPESKRYAKDSDSRIEETIKGTRPVYSFLEEGMREISIYDGEAITTGMDLRGPAIVEYPDTTVRVLEGQRAGVDEFRNLIIEEEG